mgnify:CR=1 FL=1
MHGYPNCTIYMSYKIIFLVLVFVILASPLIQANDKLIQECGGDDSLIIGCLGDEELIFLNYTGEAPSGGAIPSTSVIKTGEIPKEEKTPFIQSFGLLYLILIIIFLGTIVIAIIYKKKKSKS